MNVGIAALAQTHQLEIDRLMDFCYRNGAFNGTILVVENEKIIYNKAFGIANFKTNEPLKINSAFYLGSVAKQFTAMAIMILKEQNKLSYSDGLLKYFPEFPEYASKITIKNLLTHTSGLSDYYDKNAFKPGFKNEDVLSFLIKQPALDFEPGEKYYYSNSAYVLLSMIVEKVTGEPYRVFMEKNVFTPLSMNSTFVFDESKPEIKNRVTGYNLIGEKDDYDAYTTGGGGMYSTTDDLYLWDMALNSNKLISKDALDEAFSSIILNDGTISNYGYGWMIEYVNNYKSVFHTGGLAGFRTNIHKDLKNNNTVILLSNNGNANALKYISRAIQDILCKTSINEYKFPVSLILFKISQNQNIEQVINRYKEIAKNNNDEFDISEIQLNAFGYMLLMDNRKEDALEVFKFNLGENPKIINP